MGASVIHPKTLKPLQNKKIPLLVKSFADPSAPGTIIDVDTSNDHMVPSFIFKKKSSFILHNTQRFFILNRGQFK